MVLERSNDNRELILESSAKQKSWGNIILSCNNCGGIVNVTYPSDKSTSEALFTARQLIPNCLPKNGRIRQPGDGIHGFWESITLTYRDFSKDFPRRKR